MKLSEELIKVHPTFGMMGFYKEEKRRIYSNGLFAHLLPNGMLHTKTYLYAHRLRRKSRHRDASLVKNYANRLQRFTRIHPLLSYHSATMTGAVLSSATSIEKGEDMGIATRQ